MAFLKVCDKCGKPFNDDEDEITIELCYKKNFNSILKVMKKIHLHHKCFTELFNGANLEMLKEVEVD